MSRFHPSNEQLKRQIEAVNAQYYSPNEVEKRIAQSLIKTGRYEGQLNAGELAIILRNLVYTVFDQHTVAGREIELVHNIPSIKVRIDDCLALISFIVHIHRPITAFIKFRYALVNDYLSETPALCLKNGTLKVSQETSRLDIKSKAALAAINIESLAQNELANPANIILKTLPQRLASHGVEGNFTCINLVLVDRRLNVCLEGEFRSSKNGSLLSQ